MPLLWHRRRLAELHGVSVEALGLGSSGEQGVWAYEAAHLCGLTTWGSGS